MRAARAVSPAVSRWAGPEGRGRGQAVLRHLLAGPGLEHAGAAVVARTLTRDLFAAHHLRSLLDQLYQGSTTTP